MWKGDWLPKTNLIRNNLEVNEENDNLLEKSFTGGGIIITPLEPMRKWRLQFNGNLCNSVSQNIQQHTTFLSLLISPFKN